MPSTRSCLHNILSESQGKSFICTLIRFITSFTVTVAFAKKSLCFSSRYVKQTFSRLTQQRQLPRISMAWTCSGDTNSALIENMWKNGLITDARVKEAFLKVQPFPSLLLSNNANTHPRSTAHTTLQRCHTKTLPSPSVTQPLYLHHICTLQPSNTS